MDVLDVVLNATEQSGDDSHQWWFFELKVLLLSFLGLYLIQICLIGPRISSSKLLFSVSLLLFLKSSTSPVFFAAEPCFPACLPFSVLFWLSNYFKYVVHHMDIILLLITVEKVIGVLVVKLLEVIAVWIRQHIFVWSKDELDVVDLEVDGLRKQFKQVGLYHNQSELSFLYKRFSTYLESDFSDHATL